MVINKFCQYLLINQRLENYSVLKKGICNALSFFFLRNPLDTWLLWLNECSQWDGKQETLSEVLNKGFASLEYYVNKYQLENQNHLANYLGIYLYEFINKLPEHCGVVLSNPWHSIALKRISKDGFLFFDPNFKFGPLKTCNALKNINNSLGSVVSVAYESYSGKIEHPRITTPDDFLAQGGLLVLMYSANTEKLLQALGKYHFSLKGLEGLFLYDTNSELLWLKGLQSRITCDFTAFCLQQCINIQFPNIKFLLKKGLQKLSHEQKNSLCIQLKALSEKVHGTNDALLLLIRWIEIPSYVDSFATHLLAQMRINSQVKSLNEYCNDCLTNGVGNRLIKLNTLNDLSGMRYALELFAKEQQQAVFYIHSAQDLLNLSRKTVSDLPEHRSRFSKFLHSCKESGHNPVILVNLQYFKEDEFGLLSDLLGDREGRKRRLHAKILPDSIQLISLVLKNDNNQSDISNSDLHACFTISEQCPVDSDELVAARPMVRRLDSSIKPDLSDDIVSVDLFHASNWHDRLVHSLIFKDGQLVIEPGPMMQQYHGENQIIIRNGPWDDIEFKRFWDDAIFYGYIECDNGYRISVPKDLEIICPEGYDWKQLNQFVLINSEHYPLPQSYALNPGCFNSFLDHYAYSETDKEFVYGPGYLEHLKEQMQCFAYLTHVLEEDQWGELLTKCQKHQVQLILQMAPDVSMPSNLSQDNHLRPLVSSSMSATLSHSSTRFIQSTDIDVSLFPYPNTPDCLIFDVSECNPYDLIGGVVPGEDLRLDKLPAALLDALAANKTVVLKGYFSDDLVDLLAPCLLVRLTGMANSGQLVLISDQSGIFSYLPGEIHQVTVEEKLNCLGPLSDSLKLKLAPYIANDPLVKLIARRDYYLWLSQSENNSSDEAWAGMHNIDFHPPQLKPLDAATSAMEAAEFTEHQKEAVRKVLDHSPYVFLAGMSGVGKTTFVSEELCQPGDRLYEGIDQIAAWYSDQNPGKKYLFLDEVTLIDNNLTVFEGLYHALILGNGVANQCGSEHKLICAANPVSYSSDRKLASFFERHGNSIIFDPLPTAVLYEKILKPVYSGTPLEEQAAELSHHFLEVYRFIVSISKTDVLISPRELQMMALLTVAYCKYNTLADQVLVARHFAYELSKNLVPQVNQKEFVRRFSSTELQPNLTDDVYLPYSHLQAKNLLTDMLVLRAHRQDCFDKLNPAQRYGGLGRIVFEAEPGIKTINIVLEALRQRGYKEIEHFKNAERAQNSFYIMPSNLSLADKIKKLIKCYHNGIVVVSDRINCSPLLEALLNQLLMGRDPNGNPPETPGFMFIGMQNPIYIPGRRESSTAFLRRVSLVKIPALNKKEMRLTLLDMGLDLAEAKALILVFASMTREARNNYPSMRPTFEEHILPFAQSLLASRNSLPAASSSTAVTRDKRQRVDVVNSSQISLKRQRSLKRLDIQSTDIDEATPIWKLIENDNYHEAQWQIQRGADVNCANLDGKTPLLFAVMKGDFVLVDLLINSDADPNSIDCDNNSPLLLAAKQGHIRIISKLLNSGALVNRSEILVQMASIAKDQLKPLFQDFANTLARAEQSDSENKPVLVNLITKLITYLSNNEKNILSKLTASELEFITTDDLCKHSIFLQALVRPKTPRTSATGLFQPSASSSSDHDQANQAQQSGLSKF